jgi:hypothetical protein
VLDAVVITYYFSEIRLCYTEIQDAGGYRCATEMRVYEVEQSNKRNKLYEQQEGIKVMLVGA